MPAAWQIFGVAERFLQPLSEMPAAERRQIRIVLCDVDDTLTFQGRLPANAYSALEQLQQAGLVVIPVTGRPAGWCDHIARMWPVDAVVGENGAFYFRYDDALRQMNRHYWNNAVCRGDERHRIDRLAKQICQAVPGAAVAADQGFRHIDLAIDYREDTGPLGPAQVAEIVAMFKAAGATAKVSSIHVNGWFGDHDKRKMVERLLHDEFDHDLGARPRPVVFVGDSPNDAPLFAGLPNSVGVANVMEFAGELDPPPAWVTSRSGGHGFAELAEALLSAR
jgi:HAD superfamily hydrolase (TIGR01484 family)